MHTAFWSISGRHAEIRICVIRGSAFALRKHLSWRNVVWRMVLLLVLTVPLAVCSERDFSANQSKSALVEQWLSSVIIPKVEFRQTPLREAIDSLRQELHRLDAEGRGVSIFLKLKQPAPAAMSTANASTAAASAVPGLSNGASEVPATTLTDPAGPRITLSLSNVSFLAALRAVASQAGLKVKVETYVVAIFPVDEMNDALITAEFNVAPKIFGVPSASRFDAMSWLKKQRITFPPGASATYVTSKKRLVVRNTQENIDRIEALVSPTEVGK